MSMSMIQLQATMTSHHSTPSVTASHSPKPPRPSHSIRPIAAQTSQRLASRSWPVDNIAAPLPLGSLANMLLATKQRLVRARMYVYISARRSDPRAVGVPALRRPERRDPEGSEKTAVAGSMRPSRRLQMHRACMSAATRRPGAPPADDSDTPASILSFMRLGRTCPQIRIESISTL